MTHFLLHFSSQALLLVLLLCAIYGFGAAALDGLQLPCSGRLEHWLFSEALGFGIASMVMLGLGALGLYSTAMAWILVVLGVALGARQIKPSWSGRLKTAWARQSGVELVTDGALVGLVLLALGYTLVANALTPPTSFDVVAYHLAIPKIYIEAHRVIYIPYIVYSNWPLGTEMLYTLGLLMGSELLPLLISWSFAVLLWAGLIAFAKNRLLPWTSLLAAAIFFSIPMVVKLTGSGLIEIPLTCYGFLAFYAFWRWRETSSKRWFVISAVMGGFAASTKLNAAAIPIVIAGLGFILELFDRRPRRAVIAFAAFGLLSLSVVFPWYLKSWVFTGDPLWPFLQPLFGGRDWDVLGTEYLLGYLRSTNLAPTLLNWGLGFWYVMTDKPIFGSFFVGPYLLVLMPLAIFPAIFVPSTRSLLGALAWAIFAFYSVWFLLTHQTRFLMPAMPFMALLAATGVAWLWKIRFWPAKWAVQVALLAWLVAGTWILKPADYPGWALRWAYLHGDLGRDDYLSRVYAEYPVFQYANNSLPLDARILLDPHEVLGFYLDRPYVWSNQISQRFVRIDQFQEVSSFCDWLRQIGVTHVMLSGNLPLPAIRNWDHDEQLVRELVQTHGQLLFEGGNAQLYELR